MLWFTYVHTCFCIDYLDHITMQDTFHLFQLCYVWYWKVKLCHYNRNLY